MFRKVVVEIDISTPGKSLSYKKGSIIEVEYVTAYTNKAMVRYNNHRSEWMSIEMLEFCSEEFVK